MVRGMISPINLYGDEALDDPLASEFERARSLLETDGWRRGLEELTSLAHRGSTLSTLCIAGCMAQGFGYDVDLPGAERWYDVAVQNGSTYGLYGLGVARSRMGHTREALAAWRLGAARGSSKCKQAMVWALIRGYSGLTGRLEGLLRAVPVAWEIGKARASMRHPQADDLGVR